MSNMEKQEPFTLRAENLTYTYDGARVPVFSGVSFTVRGGEILGLGGINGSGKSSLLTLAAGLFGQEGSFFLGSGEVEAGTKLLRRETCLLMQDANMQIFGATVGEDLLLCRPDFGSEDVEEARRLAGRLGLLDVWECSPDRLSYGQKRKLCLATALLDKPRLILLDEPFSGLDYPAAYELLAILRELKEEGMAVMVSVHDFRDVFSLLSSILLLPGQEGQIPFFGPAREAVPKFGAYGLKPFLPGEI